VRTVGEFPLKFCRPRSQAGPCRGVQRTPRGSSPAWRGHRSGKDRLAASDWRRLTLKVRAPCPARFGRGVRTAEAGRRVRPQALAGVRRRAQARRDTPKGPEKRPDTPRHAPEGARVVRAIRVAEVAAAAGGKRSGRHRAAACRENHGIGVERHAETRRLPPRRERPRVRRADGRRPSHRLRRTPSCGSRRICAGGVALPSDLTPRACTLRSVAVGYSRVGSSSAMRPSRAATSGSCRAATSSSTT
jgi:hypothetical protein